MFARRAWIAIAGLAIRPGLADIGRGTGVAPGRGRIYGSVCGQRRLTSDALIEGGDLAARPAREVGDASMVIEATRRTQPGSNSMLPVRVARGDAGHRRMGILMGARLSQSVNPSVAEIADSAGTRYSGRSRPGGPGTDRAMRLAQASGVADGVCPPAGGEPASYNTGQAPSRPVPDGETRRLRRRAADLGR